MPKSQRMRSRRRYIAVEIDNEQTVNGQDFYDAVYMNILRLFGEYGVSQTEPVLIEYDARMKRAILRCSHKGLDSAKAAIVAVTSIKNEKAAAHILLVSGTVKTLRKKIESLQKKTIIKNISINNQRIL
ncbi:MAG: Rpp14/Pop5 family protein [Candidatus Bathyarchaeia archaeon]